MMSNARGGQRQRRPVSANNRDMASAAIATRRGTDQTPNTARLNSRCRQKERRAAEHRRHGLRAGMPEGDGRWPARRRPR